MKIEPLGDSAVILRDLDAPAYQIAAAIDARGLPGVFEAVASYETVGVFIDAEVFDPQSLASLEVNALYDAGAFVEIPVCYELGEDLEGVAQNLGLLAEEVVRLHASETYRCFAVGFCPGFPYLGYLPPPLSGVARRPSPRVRIEPGSVAITGRQTGIYPLERPGGWALIGRTPLCLVDVNDAYFPLKAGDRVKFVPIGLNDFGALLGERL